MGGHNAKIGPDGRVVNVKDYANRTIRNKRYKLWIENSKPSKFFDLAEDSYEKENLIESKDPVIVEARRVLESVIRSLPSKDGNPIYDANPPQTWDKKASALIPKSGEQIC